MRVIVQLEYEITGDIESGINSLTRAYSYFQGRTESIGGYRFDVKCIQDEPTIIPSETKETSILDEVNNEREST